MKCLAQFKGETRLKAAPERAWQMAQIMGSEIAYPSLCPNALPEEALSFARCPTSSPDSL
jgi:hypothetical protein